PGVRLGAGVGRDNQGTGAAAGKPLVGRRSWPARRGVGVPRLLLCMARGPVGSARRYSRQLPRLCGDSWGTRRHCTVVAARTVLRLAALAFELACAVAGR